MVQMIECADCGESFEPHGDEDVCGDCAAFAKSLAGDFLLIPDEDIHDDELWRP